MINMIPVLIIIMSLLHGRIVTKLSFFSAVESGKHFEVIVVCISVLSAIVFIIVAVSSVKRYASCNTFIDICLLIITNLNLL